MYHDIDDELPYGKERIIIFDNGNFKLKDVFENMSISPERKLLIRNEDTLYGIITLSDIFNIINLKDN